MHKAQRDFSTVLAELVVTFQCEKMARRIPQKLTRAERLEKLGGDLNSLRFYVDYATASPPAVEAETLEDCNEPLWSVHWDSDLGPTASIRHRSTSCP
jgi:hypothetical protein